MRLIDADQLIADIEDARDGYIGTHEAVAVHNGHCAWAISMISCAPTENDELLETIKDLAEADGNLSQKETCEYLLRFAKQKEQT